MSVPVRRATRGELAAPSGALVVDAPLPGGGAFRIIAEPSGGYRFTHAFYGDFRVPADGSEVVCAPNDLPDWVWERFVVAQPLPLVSLLRGHEPLHASGVALDGGAVLLMGTSGAGKSSVALHLAARGASFLTDDVAALAVRDGVVVAHPGVPLASVDARELERMPGDRPRRWRRLGALDGEVRLVVDEVAPGPLPVAAIFVLRRTSDARELTIAPSELDRAHVLLGGTFIPYVRDAARLARQLDVAARLAATVPVLDVVVPPSADAAAVATAIRAARRAAPTSRRSTAS